MFACLPSENGLTRHSWHAISTWCRVKFFSPSAEFTMTLPKEQPWGVFMAMLMHCWHCLHDSPHAICRISLATSLLPQSLASKSHHWWCVCPRPGASFFFFSWNRWSIHAMSPLVTSAHDISRGDSIASLMAAQTRFPVLVALPSCQEPTEDPLFQSEAMWLST